MGLLQLEQELCLGLLDHGGGLRSLSSLTLNYVKLSDKWNDILHIRLFLCTIGKWLEVKYSNKNKARNVVPQSVIFATTVCWSL